jgi:collagenase-like PrtC family protease
MDLIAGVSNITETMALLNLGIKNFFCSVVQDSNLHLNHRPNTSQYNFASFEEFEKAAHLIHKQNGKITFLMNEKGFSDIKISVMQTIVERIDFIRVDAVVLSDITLLDRIPWHCYNLSLYFSSTSACFNSLYVRFLKNKGVSRIILPQQLSPFEIKSLIRNAPEMEYETFFLSLNNCINIDGFCFLHDSTINYFANEYPIPCSRHVYYSEITSNEQLSYNPKQFSYNSFEYLFEMNKLGIQYLKLGFRGYNSNSKIIISRSAIKFITLFETVSKDEFLDQAPFIWKTAQEEILIEEQKKIKND